MPTESEQPVEQPVKKSLKSLTNTDLFAVLLAALYVKYDHGGYSFGRSLQSDAIEFRHLIPSRGHPSDYEGNILEEVCARIIKVQAEQESDRFKVKPAMQLSFDLGPKALETQALIQYTLCNLYWWYIRCAKKLGFMDEECPKLVRLLLDLHTVTHGDLVGDLPVKPSILVQLANEIRDRYSNVDNPDRSLYPFFANEVLRLYGDT
ncbi:MAG: hypothetical protein RIQ72_465 [Candidatus Parcubacteria bacterium]|jgi:hypothetical protein